MELYTHATSEKLFKVLNTLMGFEELVSFRLVGGTSLSLQIGHRISDDIDLFTDADAADLNFGSIDKKLGSHFTYVDKGTVDDFNIGIMRFVGDSREERVKLDLFTTDPFIRDPVSIGGIRFAHIEDIAAMKLETISRGGRKKDFWDIAELLDHYCLGELIGFYLERYPHLTGEGIVNKLTDFSMADDMDPPDCLRGRYWEVIKDDIKKAVQIIGNH